VGSAIGRNDWVENLSAQETTPAFEGQGAGIIFQVFKDVLHHHTMTAMTFHDDALLNDDDVPFSAIDIEMKSPDVLKKGAEARANLCPWDPAG
jgi:hypothetical protein